jgi:hypothetical protein
MEVKMVDKMLEVDKKRKMPKGKENTRVAKAKEKARWGSKRTPSQKSKKKMETRPLAMPMRRTRVLEVVREMRVHQAQLLQARNRKELEVENQKSCYKKQPSS